MEEFYLYTFESTHAAIASEKILKPAGCIIMPVPRYISASCGISVRIPVEMREQAEALFEEKSGLSSEEYSYYHITIDKENSETHCDNIQLFK